MWGYQAAYFCVGCEKEICPNDMYFCQNVCPHCGWVNLDPNNEQCDIHIKPFKWVRDESAPWWKFWVSHYKREFKG